MFYFQAALVAAVPAKLLGDPCPQKQLRDGGGYGALAALPALPVPGSTGGSAKGAHLRALAWFLLCVCSFLAAPGVCSLLHAGSRAALCPSRAVAGGRGAVGPCRYPVLSSPAVHPSTAGPRGAAGTHTRCLPQPRQFSEVARALCCHGVFRAGRHWRVFSVTCSQRRAAREGGVFRWCWIYELKSSHLASSVSGCRKANVTMEVGRVKTRNPS